MSNHRKKVEDSDKRLKSEISFCRRKRTGPKKGHESMVVAGTGVEETQKVVQWATASATIVFRDVKD